jgi:hypothetical protein
LIKLKYDGNPTKKNYSLLSGKNDASRCLAQLYYWLQQETINNNRMMENHRNPSPMNKRYKPGPQQRILIIEYSAECRKPAT